MPKSLISGVSMADVARHAGVSESTVSRALNNNPAIKLATRQRIQQIAQTLGYKPNIGARNLRLQRSHIVAVVINHDGATTQSLADPFMTTITAAIADALNERNYGLLLASSNLQPGTWYEHLLHNGRADGLIVIGRGTDDARFADLLAADAPFVVWGQADSDTAYTCIGSDNFMGGQQAAQQLLLSGRSRPQFLGNIQHAEIRQRYAGYQHAFRQAHIAVPPPISTHGFAPEHGYKALKHWLARHEDSCDGLFAASDNLGLGALQALHEASFQIPGDLAVVGFDDIDMAAVSIPPLTTIHQEIKQGGKRLVNALMDKLAGHKADSCLIPTRVVIRQSSCHIGNRPPINDL
ncbi:LacI family transcriptional regulator [Salinispirillum sp. LH 10-3-1]|uniref:LacI family transcriptional regulator n=1 Tax=Salinispirillum sp. LH 10-3-1 TaxID=2952525 RepID=A0AB38YIG9_9GAMM